MKKALIFIGTRPEAIKLIPVYLELKRRKTWRTQLISTGQHREMLKSIFDFFEVHPDEDLQLMTSNQSLDGLTSLLLQQCSECLKKHSPDIVIVQGDTTTAMAAGMAAYYQRVKVAHVEAGLRSYDITAPFPEEVNRRVISLFADFHFAPTRNAAKAIHRESVNGKVFIVGNTVIDSLLYAKRRVLKNKDYYKRQLKELIPGKNRFVLITGHRRESFGKGFSNICQAIRILANKFPDYIFIYPVHLNPNVRTMVYDLLGDVKNVRLIEPVPYDQMVFLMMQSTLILTDSGGIQEEAPTLGKPVIVMREKTERPEGVKAHCSVLAGTSTGKIISCATKLLDDVRTYNRMAKAKNPYGNGNSAKLIASILNSHI